MDQPSWNSYSAPAGNICAGTSVSFSVAVIGGLGGTINWVRALTPGGAGITVTSPDFPPAVGTYYYRPQYSATGSGCSLADGTETQVNVVDQPSWITYSAPAGNICAGTGVSFSVAVIGGLVVLLTGYVLLLQVGPALPLHHLISLLPLELIITDHSTLLQDRVAVYLMEQNTL